MVFSNFRFNVVLRVLGLVVTIFLTVNLFKSNDPLFIQIVVLALLVYQIANLLKYIQRSNDSIISFLNSIRYDDMTGSFQSDAADNTEPDDFRNEFLKAMRDFKRIRQEKEAEFQYLKNIVQHIGIGILTFRKSDGEVQILNTAAKRLLRINHLETIQEVAGISQELFDTINNLRTGGRDLLRLYLEEDIVQLAIYVIELNLKGEDYKLISIQNIQSELEENEMTAWQNLVRVLTHEIMNSITPISSLADTVKTELAEHVKEKREITDEDIDDLQMAIKAIQKRSEGLIRFVQDFRSLTQLPEPRFALKSVKELLDEVLVLMKKELDEAQVSVEVSVEPVNISINADKQLISQVLINLIKNAMQSFDDDADDRQILIRAYFTDKSRPVISISDNGSGIDEDAIQRIFIPFFTTKKHGSGIGLSLSRQVMRRHNGTLTVKSTIDVGTSFFLRF